MSTLSYFYNAAAASNDPIERMKLVITHSFSYFYPDKSFEKPVESELGETLQAYGQDGCKVFLEQTCVDPPRSHFLIEGPDGSYTYSGYWEADVRPGIMST